MMAATRTAWPRMPGNVPGGRYCGRIVAGYFARREQAEQTWAGFP